MFPPYAEVRETGHEQACCPGAGSKTIEPDYPSSGPLIDSARQATETCFAWNGELLRFASDRFHQDAELGFALTKCRSWTEAAELQRRWAVKTTQDWLDEGARLLRVATRRGADLLQTAAEEAERAQS
jgi:hypothetical protein